jgi:hypothetical protein
MIPHPKWLLIGVAAILALPKVAADADLGPWHFVVTAAGNGGFRADYAFASLRACKDKRDEIRRGVAGVLADGGRTSVGRLARRLNIGPCEAVRRGR